MIARRASEIIRMALTMSQIQNSDALSWRDKIDMLNQSYIRLYDDLNNNGDLYYSKEIQVDKIEPGPTLKIRLPGDFWKLLLVGYRSSRGEIVPIERAPNAGQYFSGYRIINNELVFNPYFAPGPIVVRYLPQPQTITFPRPGCRIQGKGIQAAYDSVEDVIVLGNAGGITVIDSSGSIGTVDIEDAFILAVSGGIIYIVKETGIACYDFDLNQVSSWEGELDLYAHSIGWEEGIIVSQAGEPMGYISGGEPESSGDYWNFIDGTITRRVDNDVVSFIYADNESSQDITSIFQGADSYVIADPYIYINKAGSVKVYYKFLPTDIAPATVGRGTRKGIVLAAEANNETGFGVIYRDFYSGLNLLGYAADTVLNYPQQIFYDWLAADLAVKFRIALDIPTGELPALLDDYHDTLMKGMSRDSYQSQRINNLYGRSYL